MAPCASFSCALAEALPLVPTPRQMAAMLRVAQELATDRVAARGALLKVGAPGAQPDLSLTIGAFGAGCPP